MGEGNFQPHVHSHIGKSLTSSASWPSPEGAVHIKSQQSRALRQNPARQHERRLCLVPFRPHASGGRSENMWCTTLRYSKTVYSCRQGRSGQVRAQG